MLFAIATILLASCVGKKKYTQLQTQLTDLQRNYETCQKAVDDCRVEKEALRTDILKKDGEILGLKNQFKSMEKDLEYQKKTNTNLLDRLSDLSVVNKTGAESIKKSLEALNEQSKYIMDLNTNIQRKDSINLALVMNLKRSLANVNDEDVTVEVKKGVVYISLSDKMLFKTAKWEINPPAEVVLGKVASVLKDHKDLEILVEGHTDSVPINNTCVVDNWDLSVKRATSIVRFLQTKHGISPERMTAGGRGEYLPKTTNETDAGRRVNRRTEIIITPKLEQFFNLLTPQK